MQAIILAGGLGTRLRPLTYTIPKPLLPILNEPMVVHLIKSLPEGVSRVVLAANYKIKQLRNFFEEHDLGVEVVIVEEKEPLGTGGAIKNAEKYIDDTFIAANGDVISSLDMNSFTEFHEKKGGIGSISLWEVDDPTRFGIVGIDAQDNIVRFLEKPKPEEIFSNWINAGVYILEPKIFDFIEAEKNVSMEREVFPIILDEGLYGYRFKGHWIDAGTPETYIRAHQILLKNNDKEALIGENCHIAPNAKIGPCACLGNNVRVGEKTKIHNSVVLNDAQIGRNCSLKRSIIGMDTAIEDDVEVEEGAVIGNKCILKKGTKVPPGAKING